MKTKRGHTPVPGPSLWHRLVLLLLPGHLRDEHQRELEQFLELDAPPGGWARFRFTWILLLDVLRAAPRAHADVLRQDLALAFRQLRRAPAYASMAVLTLAVGIGGNAALFSVVDRVLLRPLPYIGSDRLALLEEENPSRGLSRFGISPANFRDLTAGSEAWFQAVAAWQTRSGTVRIGEDPDRVSYAVVSAGFFDVFRERPVHGRTLQPEDDVPGGSAVLVSHAFWERRLGADPDAIGRTFPLEGAMRRVVGVMPEGFEFPSTGIDLWAPLGLSPDERERRGARFLGAVVRLADGVELGQATRQLEVRAMDLANRYPETNREWTASLWDLRSAVVGDARAPLLLVWCAAGLILLIAVANVANLVLGRGAARTAEMALRGALGARPGRLTRQMLTEGGVLAGLGGIAGLALAAAVLAQVRLLGADAIPRADTIGLSARTLVFTVLLVGLSAVFFSVLPAWVRLRGKAAPLLRGARSGHSPRRARWQAGLVVSEISLAIVVLIASTLLVRSMARLLDQPLGYIPQNVTTFRIEPPVRINPDQPIEQVLIELAEDRRRIAAAYDGMLERLRGEPGVIAAGAVNRLPLTGEWWVTGFRLPGNPDTDNDAYIRVVTPGYLEAMGTRVLRGRSLSSADGAGAETSVVIDETFARRHWSGADPVGRSILLEGAPDQPPITARVVGVAEDIHQNALTAELRPTFYIPLAQAMEGHGSNWGMDVVVRAGTGTLDPEVLRRAGREYLPDAAVYRVQSMESLLSASVADRRFQLRILGSFAFLALLMTVVGVYGVLTLAVRQRRREFGVRLALGASPRTLRWLIQKRSLAWVGLATVLGVGGALSVVRLLASQVYGISVFDPLAFLAGPLALAAAALAGATVPAVRATRTDPSTVLREE